MNKIVVFELNIKDIQFLFLEIIWQFNNYVVKYMVNVYRNNNFFLKEFNKEVVLQYFDLLADEKLLVVVKKFFLFYWYDKREENFKQQMMRNKEIGFWNYFEDKIFGTYGGAYRSFEIQINGYIVLNGCLVIIDIVVYEFRLRFVNFFLLIFNIDCKMDLLLILLFLFDKIFFIIIKLKFDF